MRHREKSGTVVFRSCGLPRTLINQVLPLLPLLRLCSAQQYTKPQYWTLLLIRVISQNVSSDPISILNVVHRSPGPFGQEIERHVCRSTKQRSNKCVEGQFRWPWAMACHFASPYSSSSVAYKRKIASFKLWGHEGDCCWLAGRFDESFENEKFLKSRCQIQ